MVIKYHGVKYEYNIFVPFVFSSSHPAVVTHDQSNKTVSLRQGWLAILICMRLILAKRTIFVIFIRVIHESKVVESHNYADRCKVNYKREGERKSVKIKDFMALVCSVDIFSFMFFSHWIVLFEKASSLVSSALHFLLPWSCQISDIIVRWLHLFLADKFTHRHRACQTGQQQPPLVPWRNSFRQSMFLRIQNLFHTDQSSLSVSSLVDYRCPVCLIQREPSLRWIALGCGHLLCSLCTQQLYFGSNPSCPHCRSPIILSDLTLLYL